MSNGAKLYWVHAVTPLHVGAGRGTGFIDLPTMREKLTGWPVVPGSAIKGVWKRQFQQNGVDQRLLDAAFGKAGDDENNYAGSLILTDARIILFPVRSLFGTFAYCTSPLALKRLSRDMEMAGLANSLPLPPEPLAEEAYVSLFSAILDSGKVFLEDLDFTAQKKEDCNSWAEFLAGALFPEDEQGRRIFQERFAILPGEAFDFLCETATEVNARIRIWDETKTVRDKALWYEESLPAETVLGGIAWYERVRDAGGVTPAVLEETFCRQPFTCQLGGKATIGKGYARCLFGGGEK